MTKGLILLTGGSGHIGFAVLVEALRKDYAVRAMVRSEARAAAVKGAKSVQPHLANLSFVVVPDFLAEGAFDEPLTGVDYVIHVAAQIIDSTLNHTSPAAVKENWMRPNVDMTVSLLRAAQRSTSVQRVILTSSASAIIPDFWQADGTGNFEFVIPTEIATADSKPPPRSPDSSFAGAWDAYDTSKRLAREATEAFLATESPHFSVIQVMPSLTYGPMELATSPEEYFGSGNVTVLAPIVGVTFPIKVPNITCHLDDVAFVHVAALDPKVKGHQNFALNQYPEQETVLEDAKEIAKKWFPGAVQAGLLPCSAQLESFHCPIDARRTEEVFGFKFRGFEDMVRYAVEGYLDLLKRTQAQANGEGS